MSEERKKAAARAALHEVQEGNVVGIGTGSTAEAFIHLLAKRVRDGLYVEGIPTSERTAELCRKLSIPLVTLGDRPVPDVTVDGADELDTQLTLIKGGGGALLREKIVAAASRRMVVIADHTKKVERLGAFPLPVEVARFGVEPTRLAVARVCRDHGMAGELTLRTTQGENGDAGPVETDGGNYILDAAMGAIEDAAALARDLAAVPGVVEHGLFVGLAAAAYVAGPDGVERIERSRG